MLDIHRYTLNMITCTKNFICIYMSCKTSVHSICINLAIKYTLISEHVLLRNPENLIVITLQIATDIVFFFNAMN